jgi:diguanylate cyclase (GGDEF)-like protein/PAS domain S-box-containing protein
VTSEVERFLSARIVMLQALATSPALDDGDFTRFDEQARQLLGLEGMSLILRDLTGQQRVNSRLEPGAALPVRRYDTDAIILATQEPQVSGFGRGVYSKLARVMISVPVLRNGAVRFFLDAAVHPVVFDDIMRRSGVREPYLGSIVGSDGVVIARSRNAATTIGRVLPGFAERTGERGSWIGANMEGVITRAEFRRTHPANWRVSVGLAQEIFDAPVWRAVWILSVVAVVLVLVSALAAWPIVRRMRAAQHLAAASAASLAENQARLRVSEERLGLALDSGEDGIWDWDLTSGHVWISERWLAMLGRGGGALQSMRAAAGTVHPDDRARAARALRDLLRGVTPTLTCEHKMTRGNGTEFWVLTRGRVVEWDRTGRVVRVVGTQIDISRRKEAEARIEHMALHDALTGLPNRTLFHDRLDQAIRATKRAPRDFAVLACDLDRFKAINDTYGHPTGDQLLRVVARRIQAVLRETDTVARLGGDEFALVLGDLDGEADAERVAQLVISALSEPFSIDGAKIEIGVSVGGAMIPKAGVDADEVFKCADAALYEAKAAGRGTCRLFRSDAYVRLTARSALALDMKDALRRGDFFLVYQPIIDIDTDAVVGFEALMRWQHPVRGLISPADFIPIAEETGLIVPLGAWALTEACREAATWPNHVRIGVNVSPLQFRDGLEDIVVQALAKSGIDARRLTLEVTESVLMRDADDVLVRLHRLRSLGLGIALDDFGTGYSSLSYLRRFPFDRIKIDRAFVREIADPDTAAIVRAVVDLGKRLCKGIVVEGVETEEQLERVRREGCNEVQGFLFSRPLPPPEAFAFITERGCAAA